MITDTKIFIPLFSPETFKTKDFYLAAAILATGRGILMDVDREEPKRMKFVFEGEGLLQMEHDWNNRLNDLNILREYADALRRMKSIIHGSD